MAALTQATIVAATHADLGRIARLLDLSVETIHIPPFNAELLMVWVMRRIEAVRVPGSACCLILTQEKAEEISAFAQGSWRTAADHLHIWAAEAANRQKTYALDDR